MNMEFLEDSLLKLVKHVESDALRTITNVAGKEYTSYGKLKKKNSFAKIFFTRYTRAF